ncbi:MAG: hypothetical protein ACK2TX_10100, partial [Anaerolineales bacterium]
MRDRWLSPVIWAMLLVTAAGCGVFGVGRWTTHPGTTSNPISPTASTEPKPAETLKPISTTTITPSPTATEVVFEVGEELTIDYLLQQEIQGSAITIERELPATFYYRRYIA